MTDRELLELAVKASGEASGLADGFWVDAGLNLGTDAEPIVWNPLTDSGDALALAVRLGIAIELHPAWVYARAVAPSDHYDWREITEGWGNTKDPLAATRRAIVRAAASIGSGKP
jgi:hypothetical protein